MIVLVPVSRFRVKYEVAAGLPYSPVERLVLKAVGEGSITQNALMKTFLIHPRLLIQSLVTLTQAGWVALGGSPDQQFVLTLAGKQALEKEQMPELIETKPKTTYVLLERVTGTVVLESQVQYVSKWGLMNRGVWNKDACLKAEVLENKLDESEVYHLLPRKQGERMHWIGPIEIVSKGAHYLVVDVDTEREQVLNLPPRMEIILKPYVIDKALELLESQKEAEKEGITIEEIYPFIRKSWKQIQTEDETPQVDWSIPWSSQHLVPGVALHESVFREALTSASSLVFIASSTIDSLRLEALRPELEAASRRGVDIHLLHGYASDLESLKWLKRFAANTKQADVVGKIAFNSDMTLSNARMLLWDGPDGVFRGIISSYDWLAPSNQTEFRDNTVLGLRVEHPAVLSALSWCAASLWAGARSETLSSVPDRWRRVAAFLEDQASKKLSEDGNDVPRGKLRVLLAREHRIMIRKMVESAQVRLLVASERLTELVLQYLAPINRNGHETEFLLRVFYGQSDLSTETHHSFVQQMEIAHGAVRMIPFLNANILVSDTTSLITSFNFLSHPGTNEAFIREIGLVIEGVEPANQIEQFLLRMEDAPTQAF